MRRPRYAAWRKKHPSACLLVACYAAGLLLLLVWHTAGLVQNRIARANGSLAAAALSVDDFELVEMERRGDVLVTTGTDPQMILRDAARRADSLEVAFVYEKPPLILNAFYAAPGEAYSVRHMAYARQDGESALFWLPAAGAQGLRFDPGIVYGNTIRVEGIRINVARPWCSFFIPAAGEVLALCALPGLFACAWRLAVQTRAALRRPKGGA